MSCLSVKVTPMTVPDGNRLDHSQSDPDEGVLVGVDEGGLVVDWSVKSPPPSTSLSSSPVQGCARVVTHVKTENGAWGNLGFRV